MDLVSSCKDKLQYFRIKELKDVLTQLGLSKQGKKQDLVDRILALLADDQVSKAWAKRPATSREEVARLVDDTYRKMQGSGASDLASKEVGISDTTLKPKEEVDKSFQMDMKVRCPCGNSLLTESMIRCEDPRCQTWQHISCVIIPEHPTDAIPPVPTEFYCELCRLSRADPFWSTVQHPLHPVKLVTTTIPTDGTNPVQGVEKTFQLSRSDKELLTKPEYAVQAWCMLLNDKVPFRMQWPQYADLQVNGVPVRAINRPGSQLLGANGRDDVPNISQFTREGINKICITGCDARIFCVGVRIVKRRTLQQILNMIPKETDGERFEEALVRVRRCVGGGDAAENADSDSDLEVIADSFTINLRCPMSGSRMKIAGRFKPCVHMGCFDLETFVEMQQRSRKWQCPICLKNYSLDNIIVDPYFNRITAMMQSCGEDTTEIEVKPDGSWRVKSDNERRDLRQWHLPDGTPCLSDEAESYHKLEAAEPIKPEGTSLKLGIKKNSNGVWEVNSKHRERNNISVSDRVHQKCEHVGHKIFPMSSSATASGRDGEESVNQAGNGVFDLPSNGGELDSINFNLQPTYGLTDQTASAAARDADIIVLTDSDEENEMLHGGVRNNSSMCNGVDFAVGPPGMPVSYQENADLGTAGNSCLDLLNPGDDEFGVPLWMPSTTQGGSGFQFFASDGDGSDALANSHLNYVNCSTSMSSYILAPDAGMNNPVSSVQDPSVGHSNNECNDGLLDNPLAFGGEDPSLQIFLPTRPSDISGHPDARIEQDMGNGVHNDDWISLRLGDGGGSGRDSVTINGFNSEHELHRGALDALSERGSFLLGSNGSRSEKIRGRSDSPFSIAHQKRSVKQRLYLSIDSDSE